MLSRSLLTLTESKTISCNSCLTATKLANEVVQYLGPKEGVQMVCLRKGGGGGGGGGVQKKLDRSTFFRMIGRESFK